MHSIVCRSWSCMCMLDGFRPCTTKHKLDFLKLKMYTEIYEQIHGNPLHQLNILQRNFLLYVPVMRACLVNKGDKVECPARSHIGGEDDVGLFDKCAKP